MKRSDTVLVYGVTGLLVVILMVAVVFGDGGPALADQKKNSAGNLADILGASKLGTDGKLLPKDAVDDAGRAKDPAPGPASQPAGSQPAGGDLQPKPAFVAADEVALLGRGPRAEFGNYRVVVTQQGETLSHVMQVFGIDRARLEEVLHINETLDPNRLAPGTRVILPWVDDAIVLAAHRQRRARTPLDSGMVPLRIEEAPRSETAPAPAANHEPKAAPALASGRTHKVVKGDSLWKIAADAGGTRNVKKTMDAIRGLNPKVDFDHLQTGTVLQLPAAK